MSRPRIIEPGLWEHPFFHRHEWWVRDVYVFLFSRWADDEGRFRADALTICTLAFPRAYPVTEEQVEDALQQLHDGGLVLLYGNGQHGFLTGWFEHQYIQGDRRDQSSLPAPPTTVNSWEAADAVKALYAEHLGRTGQNTRYDDAIRWAEACEREACDDTSRPVNEPSRTVNDSLTSPHCTSLAPDNGAESGADAPAVTAQADTGNGKQPDPSRKRVRPMTEQQLADAEQAAFAAIPAADHLTVNAFLEAVAAENSDGAISAGRRLTIIRELAAIAEEYGAAAFSGALGRTLEKGKTATGYVKAIAKGWRDDARGSPGRKGQQLPAEVYRDGVYTD